MTIPERRSVHGAPQQEALADTATFADTVLLRLAAMVRLAARIAPNQSPDDVVQDALIRAWRYRDSFDARKGTFWSWLMGIVANEARRAARHERQAPAYRPAIESVPIDEREYIGAAVRRLPPRQRLAVDCFYYADLSITETAAVMKCTEGTVKSTLADARNRLRRMLAEES